MSESMIMLQGYVGTEPILRDAGGSRVANFRVACTPRKLVRSTGQWIDGETQWYTVSAWRQLAENVARSVHRGDPVFVHGRLTFRTWTNRDGVEATNVEVEALTIGHDLNRVSTGTVKVRPLEPAEPVGATTYPEPGPRPEDAPEPPPNDWAAGPGEGLAPVEDPWAEELARKAAETTAA